LALLRVALKQSHVLSASLADAADTFSKLARRIDLSVVGQSEPERTARNMIIEAALFDSGRPVLVVPYIQREGFKLDCVMACWDGSRSAARAVGDALPLLGRAKKVEIVLVSGAAPKSDEIPGADIAHDLARHGITVELERIVSAEVDVSNVILSHAADIGTDFLVMGGYGHSRLRECAGRCHARNLGIDDIANVDVALTRAVFNSSFEVRTS
jgi:nucleotide-binding universal stress UspA family protein